MSESKLDTQGLFERMHTIATEIEYNNPIMAMGIWLDLSTLLNKSSEIHDSELFYNAMTHVFTIFENNVGA